MTRRYKLYVYILYLYLYNFIYILKLENVMKILLFVYLYLCWWGKIFYIFITIFLSAVIIYIELKRLWIFWLPSPNLRFVILGNLRTQQCWEGNYPAFPNIHNVMLVIICEISGKFCCGLSYFNIHILRSIGRPENWELRHLKLPFIHSSALR